MRFIPSSKDGSRPATSGIAKVLERIMDPAIATCIASDRILQPTCWVFGCGPHLRFHRRGCYHPACAMRKEGVGEVKLAPSQGSVHQAVSHWTVFSISSSSR